MRILWLQGENTFLAVTSEYLDVRTSHPAAQHQPSPAGTGSKENQWFGAASCEKARCSQSWGKEIPHFGCFPASLTQKKVLVIPPCECLFQLVDCARTKEFLSHFHGRTFKSSSLKKVVVLFPSSKWRIRNRSTCLICHISWVSFYILSSLLVYS